MKSKRDIFETYADLFEDYDDAEEVQLIRDLDTLYTAVEPPIGLRIAIVHALNNESLNQSCHVWNRGLDYLRWSVICLWMRQQFRALRASIGLPMNRMEWKMGFLMFWIVFGVGAAYALPPTINLLVKRLQHTTGSIIDPTTQGQQLNLKQTLDQVTVILHWAYADANHILIGYSVTSTDGRRYGLLPGTLTSTTGKEYVPLIATGLAGSDSDLNIQLPPNEEAEVFVFQVPPQQSPEMQSLRFTIDVAELKPEASQQQAVGPFIFDFSIAVEPSP